MTELDTLLAAIDAATTFEELKAALRDVTLFYAHQHHAQQLLILRLRREVL